MKSMIFLAGIICLFTSVSAFADVDPSMQPQQITSKSPFVKKIVEELKGKKLNCAPVNAKDNDATYYPLTITMSENAQGASELSVANVKGEDGLSNCCARVSYSSKKGVLRLLDG
ncbi:MAG: hypothetical protein ACXVAX_08835, partial [Pseudobdellovibrio sp.]